MGKGKKFERPPTQAEVNRLAQPSRDDQVQAFGNNLSKQAKKKGFKNKLIFILMIAVIGLLLSNYFWGNGELLQNILRWIESWSG